MELLRGVTMVRVLLALVSVFTTFAAVAQEPAAEATRVFRLEFKPEGFELEADPDFGQAEYNFKKEPAYSGAKITRGAILLNRDRNENIGYAWDSDGGKLYIDQNRNGDLTDDPDGVFSDGTRSEFTEEYTFHNVRLTQGDGVSNIPYVIEIGLSSVAFLGGMTTTTIHSGWQGDLDLPEGRWRLEVADNLDGVIGPDDLVFLYPADRNRPGTSDDTDFAKWYQPGKPVFFGHRKRNLAFAFKEDALEVAITESSPPLGELRIEGKSIRQLQLDGPCRVLLDTPGETERIPLGKYKVSRVLVQGGENVWASSRPENVFLQIADAAPASLKVGGPLQNTLKAERLSSRLDFSYSTVGVGGEPYELKRDYANPPRVLLCKGDARTPLGSFEYG